MDTGDIRSKLRAIALIIKLVYHDLLVKLIKGDYTKLANNISGSVRHDWESPLCLEQSMGAVTHFLYYPFGDEACVGERRGINVG